MTTDCESHTMTIIEKKIRDLKETLNSDEEVGIKMARVSKSSA